ncbi:hypothetical protein JXM67_15660 [candidate division WOR-3 bacterium]|nr:hypothetical protein [candidate division WOR-3 bacterium]
MKASIDGKRWELTDEPETIVFRAEYNEIDNELSIEGWSNNPKFVSEILIRIEYPCKGSFDLGEDSYNQAKIWVIDGEKKEAYSTDHKDCEGKLTITHFTHNYVAGKYYFIAQNERAEPIEVSNGRFGMPLDLLDF